MNSDFLELLPRIEETLIQYSFRLGHFPPKSLGTPNQHTHVLEHFSNQEAVSSLWIVQRIATTKPTESKNMRVVFYKECLFVSESMAFLVV